MTRPLLFLDVDGPLHPFAVRPSRRPRGCVTVRVPYGPGVPRDGARDARLWLRPAHGAVLLGLGFELCWATAWMDLANDWVGPALGLPRLPWVDFGDALMRERPDGVHWKTAAVVAHAAGRPFVWVDDEQGDPDAAHVAEHHAGRALLHHVSPRHGLREADFTALAGFAASL